MKTLLRLVVAIVVLAFAAEASAADRYFVMIFGSESSPKRARYTHTWATVVKATPEAGPTEAYALESQTISWMPASLKIRPLALRPECGVNLGLQATFRDCFCKGECVAMWGPYELTPEHGPVVWERVATQISRLNSGCVLYKCVDPDTGPKSTYMSNCIHAVSDLDRHLPRPAYNELLNNGMDASENLVRVMLSRHRFDPNITHEWVAQALGVGPCVQRRAAPPVCVSTCAPACFK